MNHFLSQSIELANQRDYLDQLFRVYPMCPDNIRDIDSAKWDNFEEAFNCNQQEKIIESLLLSDFGGHQNTQLEDAMSLPNITLDTDIIKIAILDGVCYIRGKNKMFEILTQTYKYHNILSALLLRDFLYQV